MAVAAFLHGSLLTDARETPVIAFRGVGIILLALGTLGWGTDRGPRRLLWLALVLMAAAEYLTGDATRPPPPTGCGARAPSFMGLVLLMSARRSISARITVSVGAILLVVVLAVSVALSVVIARTVEEEAFKRIDARATAEGQQITDSALDDAEISAKLAALTIQGTRPEQALALSGDPTLSRRRERHRGRPERPLTELLATVGPAALRHRQAAGHRRDRVRAGRGGRRVIGSQAVALRAQPAEGQPTSTSARSVEVVPGKGALAVGVHGVTATDGGVRRVVGVVVATDALDSRLPRRARRATIPT